MVYYNPYITGEYNPLYNPTNQGFFRGSNIPYYGWYGYTSIIDLKNFMGNSLHRSYEIEQL